MTDRQCRSCGGFCGKSRCERVNADVEWDIRGELAAALKLWPRLTGEESAELVAFVAALKAPLLHNVGANRAAAGGPVERPVGRLLDEGTKGGV